VKRKRANDPGNKSTERGNQRNEKIGNGERKRTKKIGVRNEEIGYRERERAKERRSERC